MKLITKLQAKGYIKSNKDFPQIIINSIPATELVYDGINQEDLNQYVAGLKLLDGIKTDFIVMVCNTIHLFYEQLQSEIRTPILDLRKEVKKTLESKGVKSALVLGTPSTLDNGLYDFPGIMIIKPTKNETTKLSAAIVDFNKGTEKEKQSAQVKEICNIYFKDGKVETVILACTEFSLMLSNGEFNKINTIDVLVEATISKINEIKSGSS